MADRMEIWDKARFEAYQNENGQTVQDVGETIDSMDLPAGLI